jgi:hypothetical protein
MKLEISGKVIGLAILVGISFSFGLAYSQTIQVNQVCNGQPHEVDADGG